VRPFSDDQKQQLRGCRPRERDQRVARQRPAACLPVAVMTRRRRLGRGGVRG